MLYRFTAVLGLAACQLSCTIVTQSPDAPPCPTPSAGGSAGGSASGSAGSAGSAGDGGGAGGSSSGGSSTGGTISDAPWTNVTSNLAGLDSECGNLGVVAAKPDDSVIIAGIAKLGLWRSADSGQTWEEIGTGKGSTPIANRPAAVVFDPDEPKRFWEAGIYGPGVYRTDDAGDTFTQVGDVAHTDYVSIDFTDSNRSTLLAGGHEQFRTLNRSQDGGATWEAIGAPLPDNTNCTYPLALNDELFFVGCAGYGGGVTGIYRSDDAGKTWDEASKTGGGNLPLLASKGRVFWVNPYPGGLTRSLDGGKTWEDLPMARELGVSAPPVELPDTRLAVLGKDAVFVSEDDGDTFRPVTGALPYGDARGLTYSSGDKAFYIWRFTCEDKVPEDAIMRFEFDYEAN